MGAIIILGIILGVRFLIELADDGPKSLPYKGERYKDYRQEFRKSITSKNDYLLNFASFMQNSNAVLSQIKAFNKNTSLRDFLSFARQSYTEYCNHLGKSFPYSLKTVFPNPQLVYQGEHSDFRIKDLNIYYCFVRNAERNGSDWKIEVEFWSFYTAYFGNNPNTGNCQKKYEESIWVFSASNQNFQYVVTNLTSYRRQVDSSFLISAMLKKSSNSVLPIIKQSKITFDNFEKVATKIANSFSSNSNLLEVKKYLSDSFYQSLVYNQSLFNEFDILFFQEEIRFLSYCIVNVIDDKDNYKILDCLVNFESYNYFKKNIDGSYYGHKNDLLNYSQVWTIVQKDNKWYVDSIVDTPYYKGRSKFSDYKVHVNNKISDSPESYLAHRRFDIASAYKDLQAYQKENPTFSIVEFKDLVDDIYRQTLTSNNGKSKEFVDNIILNKILLKKIDIRRKEVYFLVDVCYDFSRVQSNNQIYYYRKKDRLFFEYDKTSQNYTLKSVVKYDFLKLKTQEILEFVKQEVPMLSSQYAYSKKNYQSLIEQFLADNPNYETIDDFFIKAKFDFCNLYNNWKEEKLCMVEDIFAPKVYKNLFAMLTQYSNYSFYNYIDGVEATDVELTAYHTDQKYKRIVVRIFASSYNYTIDSKADVYGNAKKRSKYSEYWTFVCPINQNDNWKVCEIIQDENYI